MVEAARKYKRVVQVGMQNRSSSYAKSAREVIGSGKLGSIHLIRVLNMMDRKPVEKTPDSPPPEGLDWDLWLEPVSLRPYNPKWLRLRDGFWDLAGGNITNDGVHQLDLVRMVLGLSYPKTVQHTGGKLFFDDGTETPDTTIATYEYDGLRLVFEQTWWTPYMKKPPDSARADLEVFPEWFPFDGTKVEIYGRDGLVLLERHGGGWQLYNQEGQ